MKKNYVNLIFVYVLFLSTFHVAQTNGNSTHSVYCNQHPESIFSGVSKQSKTLSQRANTKEKTGSSCQVKTYLIPEQDSTAGIKPSVMAPSNDNCNNAIQLTSSTSCQSTYGTVDGATPDYFNVPSCDLFTPSSNILGAGVFYLFTAVSSTHTIKVTPIGTLDAVIVLYSGGCYVLQEVECEDTPGGPGGVATLTVTGLNAGQQYIIRVYDYGSANASSGGFNICVTHQSQPQQYTISTSSTPTAGGITNGGGSYQAGQTCTVTGIANSGYTFQNWTLNGSIVSTNQNYSFTVNSNASLVATFVQNQPANYTVSTSSSPSNGGSTSGGGTYQAGQTCTVTANPYTGYTFQNWSISGSSVSTSQNYSFTVSANTVLVANFTQNQTSNYTITTNVSPINAGTVSGGGTFPSGQSCTLYASASTGFTFSHWEEGGINISSSSSLTFIVNTSRNIIAKFTQNQSNFNITTSTNPPGAGVTIGDGLYQNGVSCTVSAFCNNGFTFVAWSKNGSVVSSNPSYAFTVNGDSHLQANFVTSNVSVSEETQYNEFPVYLREHYLHIELPVTNDVVEIQVLNTLGQVIYRAYPYESDIIVDLSDEGQGVKFLVLRTPNGNFIRKFCLNF